MGELQPWFILGKRVLPLATLYPLLHGTQGEDQEGAGRHWDELQGGHQEEAPLGQERTRLSHTPL